MNVGVRRYRRAGVSGISCTIIGLMSHEPNTPFTWSSKRPANFQQMYSKYTC